MAAAKKKKKMKKMKQKWAAMEEEMMMSSSPSKAAASMERKKRDEELFVVDTATITHKTSANASAGGGCFVFNEKTTRSDENVTGGFDIEKGKSGKVVSETDETSSG